MDQEVIKKSLEYIERDIKDLQETVRSLNESHVTKGELDIILEPIKKAVYGAISVILLTVIAAIISGVIK